MPTEKTSVIQNPKCCDGNRHRQLRQHLPNTPGPVNHNVALRPLNSSSEVKHSNSPTYLWFHLGRWLHSQLYVPSGHRWSIPVKEMWAISKQGEAKLCFPQEWKESLHLATNWGGSEKTCSCSPMAGNTKANHEHKELKLLWRSFFANYGEWVTNSDCRFSSRIHLTYMTDFLCGCSFTSWAYPTAHFHHWVNHNNEISFN